MPCPRRVLKSVLHNFLGTYTSRYTDFNGYWLFGFLVDIAVPIEFDLVGRASASLDPCIGAAARYAHRAFRDQMQKARLQMNVVRGAAVTVQKLPGEIRGQVNSHLCVGHTFSVHARVVSGTGAEYQSTRNIFVARHDAQREHRRPPSSRQS